MSKLEPQSFAPREVSDLERVIDLYYYEEVSDPLVPIAVGGEGAYCYYGPSEVARLAGTPLADWVNRMMCHIREREGEGEDFRIDFENTSWRVCRDRKASSTLINMRRMATATPALAELRTEDVAVRDLILAPWLNDGGLVVFCGLTGQGKTTLAGAAVKSRLLKYGGRCVAVEDVSEMPLEGVWERGSCRQLCVDYTAVHEHRRGFAGAIRRAYRSLPATRPAILYIGEVRDSETAIEVVKAAANGMLVVTTTHAFDPATALLRISSLAEAEMGEAANVALSQALRMVVHSSLNLRPDTVGWQRGAFDLTAMVSHDASSPLANLIRKANFAQMAQVQSTQTTKLRQAAARGTPSKVLLDELAGRGV